MKCGILVAVALFATLSSVVCTPISRDVTIVNDQETLNNSNRISAPASTPSPPSDEFCTDERVKAYVLSLSETKTDEAIRRYKELVESGCDSDLLLLQFANLLASRSDYEEAAKLYRQIIIRSPDNWHAHWTLAQILIDELGKYEEGLREVETSRRLDSLGDVGFGYDFYLARANEGLGRTKYAIVHYKIFINELSKISKKDPQLIEARKRLANLEKE